ncbi:unnamed protein product [Mytilus coruscus]|uniref:DZIP3-like HEPN domain-containing protein n=1 Tax=Mytilus coruscus TaxID=42192 RepID=A0A6J8A2Z9_MYTCO|nr:unnamed protein product [Mytilus coruscus]
MATKEEDNFLRIVYLNYRVGTTALRRYFDSAHPNLASDLSSPSNKAILSNLHKPPRGQRRVLYQDQWNMLYPSPGSPVVSSANLDVTLMVCLLRNLPPYVSPPASGFDALPQSNDLSHGAHIARIKHYKNFIVSHSKDGKLSDTDFKRIWIDLEMNGILTDFPSQVGRHFLLRKEGHSDLKEKIKKIEIEQEECIPKNIRDQIEIQLKDWEKKDEMFVTTRASDYVIECIQDNSCITLTGPSGVGKSFIARHTALVLQKEGYKVIPVIKPDDIRDYYQPGKQTVFIVDDICGNFTANQQLIQSWKQLLPVINTVIADKCCKIIVSFLFNNKLNEEWFKGKVSNEQRYLLEDTCGACRLNRSTSKEELKEALHTIDGTFVYKQNGIYRTVHDKLFDFLDIWSQNDECL